MKVLQTCSLSDAIEECVSSLVVFFHQIKRFFTQTIVFFMDLKVVLVWHHYFVACLFFKCLDNVFFETYFLSTFSHQ